MKHAPALLTALLAVTAPAAQADVLPMSHPLMTSPALKTTCFDRIKQQLADPGSLEILSYGGVTRPVFDKVARHDANFWIPVEITAANAYGAREQSFWGCSFQQAPSGEPVGVSATRF